MKKLLLLLFLIPNLVMAELSDLSYLEKDGEIIQIGNCIGAYNITKNLERVRFMEKILYFSIANKMNIGTSKYPQVENDEIGKIYLYMLLKLDKDYQGVMKYIIKESGAKLAGAATREVIISCGRLYSK
tara:strand:- start:720 stop:1106 length:387 start_codon:yes stop_codon:yes gene_type:complete